MKLIPTPSKYHSFLRQDFYAFTQRCFHELNPKARFLTNWHIEVIAANLEACRRGETTRLIINVPPRSLKSLCATSFVAFLLGKDPSARIICASYAQELANRHALDCRTIVTSRFYRNLFPGTRLSPYRKGVQEFMTTQQGFRLSTSVGGVLTGTGAEYIIIDDPLKPDEALSDTQRKSVNNWFDNTLYSRIDDKKTGRIILIMQRLHEDDLVGHVLGMEPWKMLRFPAIAEQDETYEIRTPYGKARFERRAGEPLHLEREPLEILNRMREVLGEYNFCGQYQQAPAPLGGGMVKEKWFKRYAAAELPTKFEQVFQSWDTANTDNELADFSVCSTWGVVNQDLYLIHVFRKRLEFPDLKRAVVEQAAAFRPNTILVEDKGSGTSLIQDLVREGMHALKGCVPVGNKVMRMSTVTSTMENGFVHLPDKAPWLADFLHELAHFPHGKNDDQADSVSQALDWFKQSANQGYTVLEYYKQLEIDMRKRGRFPMPDSPSINRGAWWDRQKF